MGKRVVKNYPSPRLMKTIGATNQSDAEAIGELAANCFDARLADEQVNIIIDCRDDMIKVVDDGKGMSFDVLEHAVCIGEDMSRYIERGEGAKGHFGMGFKTSCATLGDFYEIITRPVDENVEYSVSFDIGDYSERLASADAWDIEIEDRPRAADGVLGGSEHGTAFIIKRLHSSTVHPGAIYKYLSEAFKGHLITGDSITLISPDGSTLECAPPPLNCIPGTKVEIDIHCGPEDIYHITGWAALDKQTHNDGNYGFNIYRNNQLVQRWEKSWFKKHLMTSRIIGEVNLDFLDSTFYKQGLQETDAWRFITAQMSEYLKPLVSASRTLSKQGNINKVDVKRSVIADLRSAYNMGAADDLAVDLVGEGGDEDATLAPEELADELKTRGAVQVAKTDVHPVIEVESLTLEDGSVIRVSCLESENISTPAPYDYTLQESDDEDASELTAIINSNHALWKLYKKVDMNLVQRLATADAIYRALVERFGEDPRAAQNLRNKWLETCIATKGR